MEGSSLTIHYSERLKKQPLGKDPSNKEKGDPMRPDLTQFVTLSALVFFSPNLLFAQSSNVSPAPSSSTTPALTTEQQREIDQAYTRGVKKGIEAGRAQVQKENPECVPESASTPEQPISLAKKNVGRKIRMKVACLNAADIQSACRIIKKKLIQVGFTNVSVDNQKEHSDQTVIYSRKNAGAEVKSSLAIVKEVVGRTFDYQLSDEMPTNTEADILIVIGASKPAEKPTTTVAT